MSNIAIDSLMHKLLPFSALAFVIAGTAAYHGLGGAVAGSVAFFSLVQMIIALTSK